MFVQPKMKTKQKHQKGYLTGCELIHCGEEYSSSTPYLQCLEQKLFQNFFSYFCSKYFYVPKMTED